MSDIRPPCYGLLVSKLRSAQQRTPYTFPYKTTCQTLSDYNGRWLLSHFREAANTGTTTPHPVCLISSQKFFSQNFLVGCPLCYMEKWGLRDLNPGPAAYEAAALTDWAKAPWAEPQPPWCGGGTANYKRVSKIFLWVIWYFIFDEEEVLFLIDKYSIA